MTTTVDATLARMFREYPSLFRTRLDALDQLFVVNGNGLVWRSGALVDRFREDPHPRSTPEFQREFAAAKARITAIEPDPSKQFDAVSRLNDRALMKWMHEIERAALPVGPLPDDGQRHRFYPLCQYAKINTVPANARPDWLAAAYETACALRDRNKTDKATGNVHNASEGRRLARELRARLDAGALLAAARGAR